MKDRVIMSSIWGNDLCCFHCGARFAASRVMPCSLRMIGAMCRAFFTEHRNCKPTADGADLKRRHDEDFQAWTLTNERGGE